MFIVHGGLNAVRMLNCIGIYLYELSSLLFQVEHSHHRQWMCEAEQFRDYAYSLQAY